MPLEIAQTLDGTLGVEWVEATEELARARIPVADKLRQPMGLVHGGVFAALAESLASAATYLAVRDDGMAAMGLSNQTSFMRPITEGTIHGTAHRRHRGRTTWLWDVEITDDEGRLCALSRVTMAVRPARPG
jgi:1,4-dihydroxy-2-naphthoyl-CoA hydrolase